MKAPKGQARPRPSTSSITRAGPPLVLDLGPAIAYAVRRLSRHLEALPDGGQLAVNVGARRVLVERKADGWTLDGADFPTLASVTAELRRASAAWLVESEAA